jgi:hypothetical protein
MKVPDAGIRLERVSLGESGERIEERREERREEREERGERREEKEIAYSSVILESASQATN